MMLNGVLATWSYSVYLTLNELSIILYLILLVLISISGVYWGYDASTTTRYGLEIFQIMGLMVNITMHIVVTFYVARAYWYFR